MDITTKIAWEKGKIPERIYNQLDDTRSIQEIYVSEKERAYSEIVGDPESEDTVVQIHTTYKEI